MMLMVFILLISFVQEGSSRLTIDEKQFIVDIHNEYRMNVTPNAADMRRLEWDDEVAAVAQNWASGCPGGHNSNEYGENLAFSTLPFTGNIENLFKAGLKAWHDEVDDYKYNTGECSGVCGHYTQMVDTRSIKIGCGTNYEECAGRFPYTLVCNYSPAGNYNGNKPYQKGKTCSKCADDTRFCVDKFCAAECSGNCKCKRKCKKGELDKKTCTCNCYKKKGYYGSFCKQKCKNTDECINRGYDTWPDENVCVGDYFTDLCPLKCHPDCEYFKNKKG
ncbi:GLIPR1-like protein 1 [Antedon mediterranea]|uniref:GLIPR1-like protein 1 n=1 Tax=Antedon mediterranea TaxID=105859 RepID=UPI003AF7FD5A